ncbi:NAD-dependent epimerase/dehydratase family protein [Thauera sp. SDU_THAU2]|uniref:NAD-dependent epimerase/dehydratase family protein n=1 Tax=Thauera sp. SDU_THAU2 TaxID=3136633 RepID=UPI00311E20C8
MKILITGGSGFLGAWIVRRLVDAGMEPRVFDITNNRDRIAEIAGQRTARDLVWVVGDIRNADDVRLAAEGCQGIIHLAGVLTPACAAKPVLGAEINLIGTLNAFEAARHHGIASVAYAGSAGVFGPDSGEVPAPATHYGAFKLACEGSARAYWNDHRISSVGFRPFVVYGPGRETGASAGPTLACRAAARGEPYVIPFTGASGLVYVEDVAAAFVQAVIDRPQGARVCNIVGQEASVDEVMATIRERVPGARLSAAGAPLPIAVGQSEAELDALFPARPRTSLAQGIARTIAHYQAACDQAAGAARSVSA